MKKLYLAVLYLLIHSEIPAQSVNPDLLKKKWTAYWIASDNSGGDDYGVYHFRKCITLEEKPGSFVVNVSADNRYKLYVNGSLVSHGPARSDLYNWNFETIDLAPYLEEGSNCVTAVVWNFGKQRPLNQISHRTGFILQGNSPAQEILNTNSDWKSLNNESYKPLTPELVYTYYALGPGEQVDFNNYPSGWEQVDFNDSQWLSAKELEAGLPKGVFDYAGHWMLVPRILPQMELTPQRFSAVRSAAGVKVPANYPSAKAVLEIPAHTKASLLLDQGHLTNAYMELQFSKGKDARLSVQYAEALYINEGDDKDWRAQNQKGHRDEVAGKRFVGVKDEIIGDGRDGQQFTTLDWRTFRYVKIEIETKEQPIRVDDISSVFTGYPFEMKASFASPDRDLSRILEVGWRTARLCAIDMYVDCPYYEQLQYVGDTRIQCMVSLYNSGDDRLMRNAIRQIDQSRISEGITLSRYPSSLDQQIPPFSLWWIGMVNDYYWYRDDVRFVQQFLPGIRQVLNFFTRYQQMDGRLRNPPYWEFTDWASGNGWDRGVPPLGSDGCSAVLDLQLLLAYQTAADLEEAIGMMSYADIYHERATQLSRSIKENYWDINRQLFSDTQEKQYFSQHTNTLAILTGLVPEKEAKVLATRIISDASLTQATIYFQYYVNQALVKAGHGDLYLERLAVWKESLRQGLTTWPEISDINKARSDCHAWGSSPNIEFYRTVLGIDSGGAGFNIIHVTPHVGKQTQVAGSVPHPKGIIEAQYKADRKGKWQASVTLPPGTSGTFNWYGQTHALKPGLNTFNDLRK